MKILYIIPAFQHPTVRGPHRHYHFVRSLSTRHRITLLTLVRSHVSPEAMKEMKGYTERLLTFEVDSSLPSAWSRAAGKIPLLGSQVEQKLKLTEAVRKMRAAFEDLVENNVFDLVVFHGKSVFEVIRDWEGLPLVVDFCDASSMRLQSRMKVANFAKLPILWYQFMKMRQTERELIAKTPHIAFISNRDRTAILGQTNEHEIIPIGVDHSYWTRSDPDHRPNSIIFTGVMDYGPNHDSAMYLLDKIAPLVRKRIPSLEIIIAGRDPLPELKQKAAAVGGVTVTGFVDDMRTYLQQAAVFVAPVRFGAGIQNKVLEAMAMEVPVVATSVVADGLKLNNVTAPVMVGDEDEVIAEHVIHLLENTEQRSRLASQSRMFVEEHFDWEHSAEKLERMCLQATKSILSARDVESVLSDIN